MAATNQKPSAKPTDVAAKNDARKDVAKHGATAQGKGTDVTQSNIGKDNGNGTTTIADQVVAKIAGLSIREIPGVYDIGGSFSRALGSVRDKMGASENVKQGINVEVGQTQAAVDLTLVAEYPYPLHEVADKVRSKIIEGVEGLVGLEVTEVNIDIADVHIPSIDDDDDDEDEVREIETKRERVK
ncbi:Asp23/Gls24 family envelope stress response protein [Winkia neuii]|uniref:Asp23/Gls24 family envelope stress response protein n=1 Tax=Winkia neuii TaxID=33007 RepID=A0A2I1IME5_9ACTO|nr:Asp23/Gls24 family envelope stress response protein [Winkia neuii]PKY72296.1 Asp23/Gls24 family envelope stress response protein [Winkia neuii]